MKKKKVLLINSSFYPVVGGVENSLRSLAESLSDAGADVFVVANDKGPGGKALSKEERLFGATVLRYKFLPFFLHSLSCLIFLYKLKKKVAFDTVISRSHITTLVGLFLGYNNINYIASGVYKFRNKSQNDGPLSKVRYLINNKLEALLFNRLERVYVFSESMISQVKSVNPKVDVVKVSPGIDIKRFSRVSLTDVRSKLGVEERETLLLFLGRVEAVKQPRKAIECLYYLPDNYKLLFVGDGSELQSCRELVSELDLKSRVIFQGFSDKPEDYYSASDYFLMSSSYESFGQVLLEALASGVPIIGFDPASSGVSTATRELAGIIDVDSAFTFANENTSKSLASACLEARRLTEPELYKIQTELTKNWSWLNVFEVVDS